MTTSEQQILAALGSALKAVFDVPTLGSSVLQPEKAAQFVREATDATVVLPESRFYPMRTAQRDIDRIGFAGRVLRSGKDAAGATRVLAENEFSTPATATNELIAREFQAIVGLPDDTIEENIERASLESTILDLATEAVGRDLEELGLLADTDWTHAEDDVLSKTDGWVARAANRVYGGLGGQFDPTATDPTTDLGIARWPLNMFQAMLEAIPKRFMSDPAGFRYYVDWDVMDAYRTVLAERGTQLGDRAITDNLMPPYKGIPVRYVPMLSRIKPLDAEAAVSGKVALLGHPNNQAWGVLREVRLEPDRLPKARRTDLVFTLRADADYEDENAAVAAFVETDDPDAS